LCGSGVLRHPPKGTLWSGVTTPLVISRLSYCFATGKLSRKNYEVFHTFRSGNERISFYKSHGSKYEKSHGSKYEGPPEASHHGLSWKRLNQFECNGRMAVSFICLEETDLDDFTSWFCKKVKRWKEVTLPKREAKNPLPFVNRIHYF
jgi:hypothetical protein